ncbi:MAG TPA: hypothetical protein VFM53_14270 [Anaeromyxobacteraceae bacterium]|nr:hypothetical protein [Anaeromyxobacteraceae bacterium]
MGHRGMGRQAALFAGVVAMLLALAPASARASSDHEEKHEEPSDLGLGDFFTKGWNEPWVERHRATRDMALFKVETAFVETEARFDFVRTLLRNDPDFNGLTVIKPSLAYALNRRMQLEISGFYAWATMPGQTGPNGASMSASVRFALVDTPAMAYAFQVEVEAPNRALGASQTAFAYSIAGWQDVSRWIPALGPVGLYYSLKWENLTGPHEPGSSTNELAWDVSLARTWTGSSTPVVGTFTTFLEAYMAMPLGGQEGGKVTFTLTPGVRFWVWGDHSLMAGVDLPVSHDPPFSATWRATYFLGF